MLVLLGLVHAVFPKHVVLDWQTVTTVSVGAIIYFVPVGTLLGMLKKAKFPGVEIEMKEVADRLNDQVTQAENSELPVDAHNTISEGVSSTAAVPAPPPSPVKDPTLDSEYANDSFPRLYRLLETQRGDELALLSYEVSEIGRINQSAAIVRLSTAIEDKINNIGGIRITGAPASLVS